MSPSRRLSVHRAQWTSRAPFRIAGREWTSFRSVVCEIEQDGAIGRGEALGVYYLGETAELLEQQIDTVAERVRAGLSRQDLQSLLPAGGARCALDCALWDLEAKLTGTSAWSLAGVSPAPVQTVFTIGVEDEPRQMAERAGAAADCPLLKIKLDTDRPLERVAAIRAARPQARLIVDANQAWDLARLRETAPRLAELGVLMIEQPLPRGQEQALDGYSSPVPLCADESCLHRGELAAVADRFQFINIKLDKTGGLTEALLLADAAQASGLELMVGCMGGSSLAMAPAHVLAQRCRFVDIDGPLLTKYDHLGGLRYRGGTVTVGDPRFWGA